MALILKGDQCLAQERNVGGDGSLEKAPHKSLVAAPRTLMARTWATHSSTATTVTWTGRGTCGRLKSGNEDITDPNTKFLFFDENQNLVRVKVKDCIGNEQAYGRGLNYCYGGRVSTREILGACQSWSGPTDDHGGAAQRQRSGRNPGPGRDGDWDAQTPPSTGSSISLRPTRAPRSLSTLSTLAPSTTSPLHARDDRVEHPDARFSIKENVEILGLKDTDKIVVTLVPRGEDKERVFTFKGASIQDA
ncbi:hypothetical protein SELMODRAFT_416802 [Selaginella moellendorffii]|uniref:Polyphenol oxidase central domain-containing protein n=1 Tax=Selaginella moellendorffii TaxID=88036 RepID=D8S0G4_SELML|nr:hypothetical protein SELMODRAFT_416802 [Selaginella moellendorffii]